ncbi:MAG: hypothetical protein JWN27_1997, partial [Candidatus Eremiobacteraeota bacterium]|nr:hypothetical protein [Candidatus Eremiobacteraeota bacterium]
MYRMSSRLVVTLALIVAFVCNGITAV